MQEELNFTFVKHKYSTSQLFSYMVIRSNASSIFTFLDIFSRSGTHSRKQEFKIMCRSCLHLIPFSLT